MMKLRSLRLVNTDNIRSTNSGRRRIRQNWAIPRFKIQSAKFWRIRLHVIALFTIGFAHAQSDIVTNTFSQYRAEVEKSVDSALAFLAKQQTTDGDFGNERYGKSTGIVGLVGMAFLSKGHMPGYGEFGENINLCIDYLLKNQRSNGLLVRGDSGHGEMYAHNIATLFLSECSGMVDPETQDSLEHGLARATELLIRAQNIKKSKGNQGGWRYKPDSRDSDLSCSGWALMALRSAKLNGAPVPDENIKNAVDYIFSKHDQREGRFGYTDTSGHAETLTGCGLLCLELCGFHGHESTFKAGDFILKTFKNLPGNSHEFYGNYYNAQGMFQLGGKYWQKYAEWMYHHYLPKQKNDGSWDSRSGGHVYGTAMMVLSFSVPYRQLPIYQRDETVDEDQ